MILKALFCFRLFNSIKLKGSGIQTGLTRLQHSGKLKILKHSSLIKAYRRTITPSHHMDVLVLYLALY